LAEEKIMKRLNTRAKLSLAVIPLMGGLGWVSPVLGSSAWTNGNSAVNPGDWFDPLNWSAGSVPLSTTDVVINANSSALSPVLINTTEFGAGGTGAAVANSLDLGGSSSSNSGYLELDSGSLTTTSTGVWNIGDLGTGVVTQTGGTASVSRQLFVGGNGGANGTYAISGGSLTEGGFGLYVGFSGTGTFTQSNAANVTVNSGSTPVILGNTATTGNGTYSLSGSGTLSVSAYTNGNNYSLLVGNSGTGVFSQSGTTAVTLGRGLGVGVVSGSSGTYNFGGGTLSLGGFGFVVGDAGTGTFNQTAGTITDSNVAPIIGNTSTGNGSYSLSGSGTLSVSAFNASNYSLVVGNSGTGTVTQTGTTTMNIARSLDLGATAGSTGSYSLSGGTLNTSTGGNYNMIVGDAGTGSVTQSAGNVNVDGNTQLVLGNASTGNGSYSLSGSGTLALPNTGSVTIGSSGSGTLTQTGGTLSINNGSLSLGVNSGSHGTYSFSGGTLNWTTAGGFTIGGAGTGVFNQTGGTFSESLVTPVLGNAATTGNGTISLSGTGSLYSIGGAAGLTVGNAGTGAVVQTGTTTMSIARSLDLGVTAGSTGSYSLSGGTLNASTGGNYNMIVGDAGTGSVTQSAGNVNVDGSTQLILGNAGTGNGSYTLSSTGALSLPNTGSITIGNSGSGTLNQTGGTLFINNGSLSLGANSGSHGTYSFSGGTLTWNAGGFTIGGAGTGVFNQTAGTFSESVASPVLGNAATTGNGTISLSGTGSVLTIGGAAGLTVGNAGTGTVVQNGTTTMNVARALDIAALSGSNGSYSISAGTLNQGGFGFTVGDAGTGTFSQSGSGSVSISGTSSVILGNASTGNGTYALTGSGTFTMPNTDDLYIGNAGSGSFTLNDASAVVNPSNVYMGYTGSGTSSLTVTSGTLYLNNQLFVGQGSTGAATVTQTGGVVNVSGTNGLIIGNGTGTHGSYYLSGTGQINVAANETPIIGNNGTGLLDIQETGTPLVQTGANASLVVGPAGTLQGYFSSFAAGTLTNNGKIIADGHGTANTLNLSSFDNNGANFGSQSILHTTPTNTTHAGWYAQNKGMLTLANVAVTSGTGSYEWGETQGTALTNNSLVNSVQANFTGTAFSNYIPLNISLLSPDRSEVTSGTLPANTTLVDAWNLSTNNITAGGSTVNFDFRYDDVAMGANTAKLYELIGSTWTAQPSTIPSTDILASGNYDPLSFNNTPTLFAIGYSTGPTNGSSAWAAGSGNWENANNWDNQVIPGAVGNIATFSDTTLGSTSAIVTLGASQTVGTVAFNSQAQNYTITATGSFALTLDNGGAGGGAAITVDPAAGNPVISAPLVLNDNLTATVGTGRTLSVSGNISSTGGTRGLTKAGTGTLLLSGTNSYSGNTAVNAGTLQLANSKALPGTTNLSIANNASVVANDLGGGANKQILQVNTVSTTGNGFFDLKNNDLIIHGSTDATVNGMVATGFAGGAWNGPGINSSSAAANSLTALGVATGLTTFDGGPVSASDVLVKYTYYGDATLDGHVDGSDYSIIDTYNGLTSGALWSQGDFNYDGMVDGSDYSLIDNTFNQQSVAGFAAEVAGPTSEIAGGSAAVPEPTSLGLLGIGAIALMNRRRRKTHTG
jgi:fibronectin-binding autotransporter adhesin